MVFGDIGTSPLYTIQTVFNPASPHVVAVTQAHVFGVVSLIFWAVTLIVTGKYVLLVMRADHDGEGGILALVTLIQRPTPGRGRTRTIGILTLLGIFGASLFFGDSMITPAISVLSAVEGLTLVQPSLAVVVLPVTVVIVVVLFAGQRFGTARVGQLFGPVMIVWFLAIGILGAVEVVAEPGVLAALSPTYATAFLVDEFPVAFVALSAVVLAVTGAEALYADMGDFGRSPITRAWLILVFPACMLSYLGQCTLVLHQGSAVTHPFFALVPAWGRIPMVVLATAATVIASQAVITGAFSMAHQAVELGYLPRLRTVHTSTESDRQIYMPLVNSTLMVSVLALVLAFQSSQALAYAYGMAVTGTFIITTVLFFSMARRRWHQPWWRIVLGAGLLLSVESLFFAANLTKLTHGAWLPLLIAVGLFTVMTSWRLGSSVVLSERDREEGLLPTVVAELHARRPPLLRVPGMGVFLSRGRDTAPLAMRLSVEHNQVLPAQAVILSIETLPVPFVSPDQRVSIDGVGPAEDGITHVTATLGYLDRPCVPELLQLAAKAGLDLTVEAAHATYYLATVEVTTDGHSGMSPWRKRLFIATSHLTSDAAEYFALPPRQTVVVGSRISI